MKKTPMKHPKLSESVLKIRHRDECDMEPTKYADGGAVDSDESEEDRTHPTIGPMVSREDKGWGAIIVKKHADGGMIDDEPEEHYPSVAAAVMARNRKKYADGGTVDIEQNGEEEPSIYDEQNEAALKANYDEDLSDVTMGPDSSHSLSDEDEEGMSKIARIRKFAASRK